MQQLPHSGRFAGLPENSVGPDGKLGLDFLHAGYRHGQADGVFHGGGLVDLAAEGNNAVLAFDRDDEQRSDAVTDQGGLDLGGEGGVVDVLTCGLAGCSSRAGGYSAAATGTAAMAASMSATSIGRNCMQVSLSGWSGNELQ